jgi:hypothetical protein
MSTVIVDNFEVNAQKPVDNRLVVGPGQFYTSKNDISYKYTGLRLYDLNDSTFYFWNGTSWIAETFSVGNINGSGTSNFITKFSGQTTITTSQIFDNGLNIGFGGAQTFGTEKYKFSGGSLKIDTGVISLPIGSATNPSYTFDLNANSGIYFNTSNTSLRFSVNSTDQLQITTASIYVGTGLPASPSKFIIRSNDNTDAGGALVIYPNNLTQTARYSWGGVTSSFYFKINSGSGQSIWLNDFAFVAGDGTKVFSVQGDSSITKNLIMGGNPSNQGGTYIASRTINSLGPNNIFTADDGLGNNLFFSGGIVIVEVEFVAKLTSGRAGYVGRSNKVISTYNVNLFGTFTLISTTSVSDHDESVGNISAGFIDVSTPTQIKFNSSLSSPPISYSFTTTIFYKISYVV